MVTKKRNAFLFPVQFSTFVHGASLLVSSLLAAAVLLQSSSCASIHTSRKKVDTLLRTDTSQRRVRGSKELFLEHKLLGTTLVISVEKEMVCKRRRVPVYASEEHITHTLTSGPRSYGPSSTGLFGAVALASGAYSYLQADSLAANSSDNTAFEYRNAGLASLAIGVSLLVVALVDSKRLEDEVRDLGTYEGEPIVSRRACRHGPEAKRAVRLLTNSGGFGINTATDSNGVVELSLLNIPENVLLDDDFTLALEISGKEIPIPISQDEVHAILERLEVNTASRISKDRRANLARHCGEWVEELEVHETKLAHLRELSVRWGEIGTQCKSVWQSSFADARNRFDEIAKQLREEERQQAITLAATRPLSEILSKVPTERIPEERQRNVSTIMRQPFC